jgi:hypothetical protein
VVKYTVGLICWAADVGCVDIVGGCEDDVVRVVAELVPDIDGALELVDGTAAVGETVGAVVADGRGAPNRWRGRRGNVVEGPVSHKMPRLWVVVWYLGHRWRIVIAKFVVQRGRLYA